MSPPPGSRTLVLVPRWGGSADSDWYPRTAQQFPDLRVVPLRPTPDAPDTAACVRELSLALADLEPGQVVLCGHSVGCQVILRYLAAHSTGAPFASVVLVAGWAEVDQPWPSLRPWLDGLPQLADPGGAATTRTLLLSDDDPYTVDLDRSLAAWQRAFDVTAQVHHKHGHFNAPHQQHLFTLLDALVRPDPG